MEKDKELWLVGDFNLDLSRKDDNNYSRKCISTLAHSELIERGMVQVIDAPTHRQNEKESTIDLIFTNEPRKVSKWGTISTGSSHDCVWMIRRSKYVQRKHEFLKRSFMNFNKESLLEEAKNIQWQFEGNKNDDEEELNKRVEELQWKIQNLVDKFAPVKLFKTDPCKVKWMTQELLNRIEARNRRKVKLDKEGGSSAQ